MRTVEDEAGHRYVLLKESHSSSRVFDPETGEEQYVSNEVLHAVNGLSPLESFARSVPAPLRRILSGVHSDQSLGMLVVIATTGPVSVRSLVTQFDLCESDLHGMVSELRAAGIIEECSIGGERGYEATSETTAMITRLLLMDDEQ